MSDDKGGYIIPQAILDQIELVAHTDHMNLYRMLGPRRRVLTWEERLAREIAYRSIRNRLRRGIRSIRGWPQEGRERIVTALDVLRGRHGCCDPEDDW